MLVVNAVSVGSVAENIRLGVNVLDTRVSRIPSDADVICADAEVRVCVCVFAPPVSSTVSKAASPASSPTSVFPTPNAAHVPPNNVAGEVDTTLM